jgi:hypothetical protein
MGFFLLGNPVGFRRGGDITSSTDTVVHNIKKKKEIIDLVFNSVLVHVSLLEI